ncbi:MAG: ribonuclease Z [Spirochaetales bacterium]|nr:ribonuclease Z [Spirochaetales bacterium]
MKIKVLGTGSASSTKNNSCYIIDGSIMLDMPNGSWKLVRSQGFDQLGINDIIFTHFHADHCFDVPFVFITRYKKTEKVLHFYCGENGPQRIQTLLHLGFENISDKLGSIPLKYHTEGSFDVGPYHVVRHEVEHGGLPGCYAYVFDDGEKKVGFSGDSTMCEGLLAAIDGCSRFIIECSKPTTAPEKRGRSHIYVSDIAYLVSRFPECTFYTTHMTDASRAELLERKIPRVVVLKDYDELVF